MAHLRSLLLLAFIQFFLSPSEIFSLDTNVFKYFPLKVGNRWTWYRTTPVAPGPGYESEKILSTSIINNHLYYYSRYDIYGMNGSLIGTVYKYYRIDSLTGNLYSYQNLADCLLDSLNSRKNDSARTCGGRWYRCDTGFYNIFNQSYKKKSFEWSSYFEGGDGHTFAKNIGKVHAAFIAPFNLTTWFLRGCLINGVLYGDTSLTGINKISSEVPETFKLFQNYPNPFNPVTSFKFQVSSSELIKLIVYDVLGKEVLTLVNKELSPGTYEVDFDGTDLPSGIYYYTLTAGEFKVTKRMVLIK